MQIVCRCKSGCSLVRCFLWDLQSDQRKIAFQRAEPFFFQTETQPWGRTDVDLNTLQIGCVAMVDKANEICRAMIRAIGVLQARKAPWAIENPDHTLFWSLPEVDQLLRLGAHDVFDHTCMHGMKAHRIRSTLDLTCLTAPCRGGPCARALERSK